MQRADHTIKKMQAADDSNKVTYAADGGVNILDTTKLNLTNDNHDE